LCEHRSIPNAQGKSGKYFVLNHIGKLVIQRVGWVSIAAAGVLANRPLVPLFFDILAEKVV